MTSPPLNPVTTHIPRSYEYHARAAKKVVVTMIVGVRKGASARSAAGEEPRGEAREEVRGRTPDCAPGISSAFFTWIERKDGPGR